MGSASSVTTYGMHIVGHCIHCMGTAFNFSDREGGTATAAGTQLPAEVALHPPSQNTACTLWDTASNAWAQHALSRTMPFALQPLQGDCIQMKWHCRCIEFSTGSLHPPPWAVHLPSQNKTSTLWDTASTAWGLHPRSGTLELA
ncbi:hypothetical protein DF270_16070, partial [Listeria monocytogenes]